MFVSGENVSGTTHSYKNTPAPLPNNSSISQLPPEMPEKSNILSRVASR